MYGLAKFLIAAFYFCLSLLALDVVVGVATLLFFCHTVKCAGVIATLVWLFALGCVPTFFAWLGAIWGAGELEKRG